MRKFYLFLTCILLSASIITYLFYSSKSELVISEEEEEKGEGYDGPAQRDSLNFVKMIDPALGHVPTHRIIPAIEFTQNLKYSFQNGTRAPLLWIERGPVYDSVGPSNGNGRAGSSYTSGRMRGILIDTLNDPTGNTVFAGGVAGGLWRCTNFLSPFPNWVPLNDFFDNLAISSVCQDPTNPSIMYFSTGEATSNADAVYGGGLWKSTDKGLNWTRLASTTNFIRTFKIACDAAGNVYIAARPTTTPVVQANGLSRSKDKGLTWTNITPTGLTTNAICTDIEISSTGKLHASFGYLGTVVNHRFTSDPANVTSATWSAGTGIRTTAVSALRLELAALADTLYAITINPSYNTDSCYKSVDGGATWTKQNTTVLPAGLGSQQGWYNLTLAINPTNSAEIIAGGLDAYRSTNSGLTMTRLTNWVNALPYVHADHHFLQWSLFGSESRLVIGCDGGIFISRDAGVNWSDRNKGLGLKQFYGGAIHPSAGSDYLLAGAQDNGVHQLKNPGLTYSIEVTGGDGCFVHINQANPQVQFGSYVYNQYRRSTNGGASWSSVNLSTTAGMFVNPFDYDDSKNIMYACWASNQIVRWVNANTSTTANLLTLTGLGTPSSFKVSPNTPDRVFIGSNTGRLYRLDKADTVTTAGLTGNLTNISGAGFPAGFLNCVNVGTSDNFLVAVFTNYGVSNIWYSDNAGTSWTAIDGNLPDMPVRWAMFMPGQDNQMMIATETGVWTTDAINGGTTVWAPNPGFPTVRTDMLKLRTSDNTIVAATHGRGLFTATVPSSTSPEIRFITPSSSLVEENSAPTACPRYKDYIISTGINIPPAGDAVVSYSVQAGNTAIRGVDFDFTTNGNFTTPSDQHTFLSGSIGSKNLTLRIYDDAEVEPVESFVISFNITGGSNAAAGLSQHSVTINDNDQAPSLSQNLTATFGSNNTPLTQPFRGQFSDSRTQMVYLASELTAAGFKAGNITALGFNVLTKASTAPYNGFTIKMKNSSTTTLAGGAFESGAVTVYGPVDYSTVAGANNFTLTTPFFWNGTSNIIVDICYDNAAGTATDNVAGTGGLARSHFDRIDGAAGCSLTTGAFVFAGGGRPDISFSITTIQTPIATLVNTTSTEHLNATNDLYFYSSAGEILGRVRNQSNHNYGCTQFMIDSAGTGSSQFWNFSPENYLMQKTYRIIPTTNNTSGKYEVTFYYTKQEKEGWEAATGQSWNNIQLIKVPSAINNVSPTNAQPDGPNTVQIVVPTRGTFGTGYTLTGTFETGFGGFGAGIPGRINTVLTLTGALQNNEIALTWTTSAEVNSTRFEVEKSYDGVSFRKIGISVNASGTKYSTTTYTFADNDRAQVNYYRVRMFHSDGLILLSNTIQVRIDNIPQSLIVLTNPFNNDVRVRFTRIPSGRLVFSLYDAGGKLVKRFNADGNNTQVIFAFGVPNVASQGIYTLDAIVGGKHYTVRLMRR